jgi:fatty-acid desaturase
MACHGMGWRQPDLTGLVIRLLERLRLAWAVKRPAAEAVERRLKPPTRFLGAEDSERLSAA